MQATMELRVTPHHLARNAYLYVRQSTLRQMVEHTESATRQYALRQRAIALGWPAEQIIVIDCDQGQSGASAADRAGFQQLVAEVGLGPVSCSDSRFRGWRAVRPIGINCSSCAR